MNGSPSCSTCPLDAQSQVCRACAPCGKMNDQRATDALNARRMMDHQPVPASLFSLVEGSGLRVPMKKSVLQWIQIISLIGGLGLFAYLIKQTGISNLMHYLAMMGWGFAVILALSATRNVMRTTSWYYAI